MRKFILILLLIIIIGPLWGGEIEFKGKLVTGDNFKPLIGYTVRAQLFEFRPSEKNKQFIREVQTDQLGDFLFTVPSGNSMS